MPKIFSNSETKDMRVLSGIGEEGDIVLDLTQKYVFRVGSMEKTIRSLVTLKRDGEGMITLHEEAWDHEPNKVSFRWFLSGWLMGG
jgi:hypothetical protein